MALEISIRENCAGLSSDRATERKKCAESLKSFLSGTSAPAMLSENTLKRTGYAWDNVFSQVNDYILKEAENYEKSKTFENTTKPLATSLLHMVITGSKKGKAYIKCDKIISACLFILKSQRLTKAIGDAYLNLLYKYIITSEYYVGFITPQSWDELLDVCLATCGSSHSKLDNYTKLRLVCLILRNGSRTCQFVGPLRDALPRVQKLFLAPTTDKRVQEVLIEMSLLLVETLSSEYRLATCEFTEAILGTIFKFYDQTIDKKKLLLYKLLHKMVLIHHPEGRLRNEEGSLAHNWTTWCKHLNSIVELICSEVKVMQKSSDTKFRFKDDSARDSAEFFCLAASVFYQIFNIPVQVNENEAGNASKRQKFSFTQKKAFSDLVDELRQNHVPWLGVVTMYVKHYGDKISTAECLSLLPILDSYIASNNNNLNWAIFEELACLVLGKLYPVTSRNDESGILLLAVWNSCVRNSTAGDAVHKATHSILQCLLRRESINFQNVQSLMKLYHEKAMPVTDHSVKTLCYILHAFFSKFNNTTEKFKCSNWFTQYDLCCSDMGIVQNLLLRLISNENIDLEANPKANKLEKSLYDVLFKSLEKCILFSEFELEISKPTPCSNFKIENVEISNAVKDHIRNSLEQKLSELTEKVKSKELKLVDYAKFISIVLNYLDIVLKFTKLEINRLKETQIYDCFKVSLKLLFASLTEVLKHCDERPEDIELTNIVRSLLSADCNRAISCEVRACMNKDLLISIHTVINNNNPNHEEDDMEVEDLDERTVDMRRNCMYLLAAYCKINTDYRTEIVDLISSQELYNFHNDGDIKCAIQCMSILIDSTVESPPIESVFGLISFMCKRLFSNSKATGNLLKILLLVLEEIWLSPSDVTKHNCGVIFNSYLSRCKQFYYPPNVAALIYECVAKIEQINQRLNHGNKYRDSLIEGTSGDIHSLRLYCCYLVKMVANDYNADHVQRHITRSLELFSIDVSGKNEQMLKDELANRTLTVLHSFFALAQTKSALSSYIIKAILKVQKEKSLDKNLVKKVLNKMATIMSVPEISVYLKQNILSLLHFWFSEKYPLEDLPIYLVGFNDLSTFIDSHMKWVCPAEILWCKEGNIQQSEILQRLGTDVKSTVESCFSNIMILCLPYIVAQKYNLQYEHSENELVYIQSARNAEKMFRSTNQILESKFSSLFIDKIGELVLLSASHLADYEEVKNIFGFDVPRSTESFFYPKEVYLAILKYFGDVANHDIMHFLCEQQPMIISKIILKLWSSVLQNTILESKAQALHTFITFIDSLKSGYSADHFVCNFACNSLLYAIKSAKNSEETKLLLETLRILLRSFLPDKSDLLRETLPLVVSLLKIKRDEGFEADCRPLLDIVLSEDHVDSKMLLSQRDPQTSSCISGTEFKDSLKTYLAGLSCPSFEVLSKLKRFLKANRGFINSWCRALNLKGFSEDCKMSLLHKIINILNNILTSAADDKTKIEACNCLSELGTYDLKTLVMVAPADSKNVADLKPAQYFAMVVLKHLSQLLADEDPLVVSKVIATLSRLLMFREGKLAFDLTEYDQQQILKQFNPAKSNFTTAKFQVNKTKFEAYKRLDFWLPQHTESHSKWICRITCALLHVITSGDNYLSNLGVVCKSKPCLSKTVLPPLLGLLLSISNHSEVTTIGGQINKFFNFFWDNTFNASCSENSENMTRNSNVVEHDHKLIIQDVLDVVNFVRLQRNHYIKRPDEVETYNYLKLDYDIVSWAAAICDDSLAAIFYGELWASSQNNSVPPSSPEQTANLVGGENMQSILRKCSISIGELDAIEGCGSGHLTSEQEKRKHLINTGQYADALLFHDIALSHDTNSQDDFTLEYGVVRSLHKSGMHRLALQYIKSLPENDRLDDVKYDCLSFLGDWSVFVDTNETNNKLSNPNTDMNSLLKELRYSCLKDSLNLQLETQEYEHKLVAPLNKVKLAVSKLSQKLNMDNCQSVYSVVSQLQIFNDIEDYNSVKSNKLTMKELLNKWQVEKLAPFQDFKHVETLVSQRCLILDNATKLYSTLQNDIVNLQLRYAELGLSNDRIQLSQRLLAMAKRGQTTGEVSLVEGQIAWAKGHKDIALSLLRNIMNNETPDIKLTAIALRQYGTWMAESKCENARDIIDKYLHRSLHVLGRSDNAVIRLKVYYDLAKFADAEYKQVVAYMKSTIFENKVKVMENMKNAASAIKNTQSLSRDEKKALVTNQRLSNLDEAEIQSTIAEKKRFLDLAMKYYLLSLKKDEENNLSVFRIISLWLDNPEFEFEPGEGDTFETLLNAVPSRKYVPVLPQLAPRLSNIDDAFSHNLNEIIKRCSRDHPHHTLPILFGLKNSDKDKVILNASAGIGKGRGMGGGSEEPRVIAAGELIQELASTDKKLACIISQMDLMCDAIISFANYELKSKESRQAVPKAEPISKLGGLGDIPIPTITLTIKHDCNYSNFPGIVSFGNTFEMVGGINCPKKMMCKGSDGKERTILVKGEDDLRQDAVMQQVFNIVNTLLGINPVTSRKKLLIRTYKVVPLSRRSGVLEWCEGTVPLGAYLADNGSVPGAHRRYRPRDISCNAARAKLTECHNRGKSNAEKLSAFLKILKEFKPVFHFFFFEHYLDPVTWYERRLAYTKSVATSSMVGYIMGLGDRHVQNILVDKKTAEVIHIDFGIAFDQGKALPTPETVPFRLTQDMIAGFGCSGVEGIFRRCCEKTMQLLRDNHEALLTILEVLLCDPLYSWTVTPAEAKRKQDIVSSDVTFNITGAPAGGGGLAERALLAVSSKLSGTEGGVAGGVAVPGQVARLLHSATNPTNLSRLFPGWQPYL